MRQQLARDRLHPLLLCICSGFCRRLAIAQACVAGLGAWLGACAEADGARLRSTADAGSGPVRALYSLSAGPMPFLAIPWPDDAYRDSSGHVRVRAIPSRATDDFAEVLADSMADLDGFGLRPTIYFRFDGALDPASLPADPEASLVEDSVFLLDVDTSSPTAFERIPVEVAYQSEPSELGLRPAYSRSLTPGRRYAAIVTRDVKGADRRSIDGAPSFLTIRDASAPLATPLERAARLRYAPVLDTLATLVRHGVPTNRVAAMAVFRTQSSRDDIADARALVRAQPTEKPELTSVPLDAVLGKSPIGAVGLDEGAPHGHIGFMLHGTFASPDLLSRTPFIHGAFWRSSNGELQVRRTNDVPFTLWLPIGVVAGAQLPLIIVQHGLLGERSDALALAEAFAAVGSAVIAFDAPFHGSRSLAGDRESRFTGKTEPDGFGDAPGDFAGADDGDGPLTALHPFYYRDAMRQAAVDLMALVYLLQEGDLSALADVDPVLVGTTFDVAHLGFVGTDLGGEIGVVAASAEPALATLVLAFAGGLSLDGWLDSPASQPLVDSLIRRLGRVPEEIDVDADHPLLWPDLDAWRALADRGTALAYAPGLRRAPTNIFMLMARDDEFVHNRSTEALGFALGVALVGGKPKYVPDLLTDAFRPDATLSGNFDVEEGAVTRVMSLLEPATHDTLTKARGTRAYQVPLIRPFLPLSSAITIANPIAQTLAQIVFFFESQRACTSAMLANKKGGASVCAATVRAPIQ